MHILNHHPASTSLPCLVRATATRAQSGELTAIWQLSGSLDAVRLADADKSSAVLSAQSGDQLWQQTCFEIFIAAANAEHYHEYNFSPDGHWAAYAFSHYRSRSQPLPSQPPPLIKRRYRAGHLTLCVCLAPAQLPPRSQHQSLSINLSAVLESAHPQCEKTRYSYHALHHCGARADFHQRAAFVLTLPPATPLP